MRFKIELECQKLNSILLEIFSDSVIQVIHINGPRRKKTCLRGFANNKGADQHAHPRRLISAIVIRF